MQTYTVQLDIVCWFWSFWSFLMPLLGGNSLLVTSKHSFGHLCLMYFLKMLHFLWKKCKKVTFLRILVNTLLHGDHTFFDDSWQKNTKSKCLNLKVNPVQTLWNRVGFWWKFRYFVLFPYREYTFWIFGELKSCPVSIGILSNLVKINKKVEKNTFFHKFWTLLEI